MAKVSIKETGRINHLYWKHKNTWYHTDTCLLSSIEMENGITLFFP